MVGFQDSLHEHPHDGFQESFQDHFPCGPRRKGSLLLYVDDMIVTGDDTADITNTQRYLHRQFHMKDLGHLWYFLGLEKVQAERGILILQQKYTSDISDGAALIDTKIAGTPLELHS